MPYRFIRQIALNLCLSNTGLCTWLMKALGTLAALQAKAGCVLRRKQVVAYAPTALLLVAAMPVFIRYGGLRFEQMLFFIALPFTLRKGTVNVYPRLSTVLAIVCLGAFYVVHVYSVFYLGFGLALFVALMLSSYRPTLLSFALLFITAPVFQYLFQAFSFSIRLHLTTFAAQVLKVLYPAIEQAGNRLMLDDISYTVAPECMGLNMLSSALVIAVSLMAFKARQYNLRPGLRVIVLMLIVTMGCVAIGNVSRIILTVIFRAMPDTLRHELLGLLVFVANICLPLLLLTSLIGGLFKPVDTGVKQPIKQPKRVIVLLIALTAGSGLVTRNQLNSEATPVAVDLPGMQCTTSTDGVVKYSDESALVYVKPPAFFLGAEHHPFICWQASGYEVAEEALDTVNGSKVYTFMLLKEGEAPLYSCWWYSNGKQHTCNQMKWRMAAIVGDAPYSVINVSAPSRTACLELAGRLMH